MRNYLLTYQSTVVRRDWNAGLTLKRLIFAELICREFIFSCGDIHSDVTLIVSDDQGNQEKFGLHRQILAQNSRFLFVALFGVNSKKEDMCLKVKKLRLSGDF